MAFLGGTIGNFEPGARREFLADVASQLGPTDAFLLGTDLVKDVNRLLAAYDDAAGTTDQVVTVAGLDDLEVRLTAGAHIRTEISAKFTTHGIAAELAEAGLATARQWTDDDGDFLLTLAVRD